MNLKNLFTLTIRVQDFNIVREKPELVSQLRKLTLTPRSGMNYCLDGLEKIAKKRPVQCKILTAYRKQELVGWALLSKEETDFLFLNSCTGFDSSQGTLFQVFIHPAHRRQGIATELLRVARRKASSSRLCVCPWDTGSESFYNGFLNFRFKKL